MLRCGRYDGVWFTWRREAGEEAAQPMEQDGIVRKTVTTAHWLRTSSLVSNRAVPNAPLHDATFRSLLFGLPNASGVVASSAHEYQSENLQTFDGKT